MHEQEPFRSIRIDIYIKMPEKKSETHSEFLLKCNIFIYLNEIFVWRLHFKKNSEYLSLTFVLRHSTFIHMQQTNFEIFFFFPMQRFMPALNHCLFWHHWTISKFNLTYINRKFHHWVDFPLKMLASIIITRRKHVQIFS